MTPKLLIDAIVKQTTVLVAQLSTSAGLRAPLAKVADQVFVDLAREIERQGVSRKVVADMFGLALRTYQTKVHRLEAQSGERDLMLWELIFNFIEETPGCDKGKLAQRFSREDSRTVAAIVKDLCDTGLVYRAGWGPNARYRAVPDEERESLFQAEDASSLEALTRVAIYRGAEDAQTLSQVLGAELDSIDSALATLEAQGSIWRTKDNKLRTGDIAIEGSEPSGWEAAVFDHYQAVVAALSQKLLSSPSTSSGPKEVGGTTVTFEISVDHPMRTEVLGLLERMRGEVDEVWKQVAQVNKGERTKMSESERVALDEEGPEELVKFYFGQSVKRNST